MNLPVRLKLRNKFTPTRIIFWGFLLFIFLGTLLLKLPVCHKDGVDMSFLDAAFTSTSAICVTGLSVYDTNVTFTSFGQIIILLFIQIGGLGVMSIFTIFALITKKHMDLKERLTLQESLNNFTLSGTVKMFLQILAVTLAFELIGAIILFFELYPIFGFASGLWKSIFLSVSAFCNAGFDVLGNKSMQFQSLAIFANKPAILITISALIITGGLGFIVWKEIGKYKFNFKKYSLHSKVVLISTLVLLILGTLCFYFFERFNPGTLGNMTPMNKVANSFFQSVTPRTAGFSTVNNASLTKQSGLLSIALMLIGGAPGSTAGGIKVTTISVLFLAAVFFIIGREEIQVMRNHIAKVVIFKCICIFMLALLVVFLGTTVLLIDNENITFFDALFETASAMGTVGLSTGITPTLNPLSKITLIIIMFLGRLGPLTAVIAFSHKQVVTDTSYRYSDGKISVG